MEIKRIMNVYTPEAQWMLEKRMRNGVLLIEGVLIKLSRVYDLARKQQSLYAYINLSRVLGMIYRIRASMDKLTDRFEKIIVESKFDLAKAETPVVGTRTLRVGVILGAELCTLIESYDRFNLLIRIADKMNLFKSRSHWFGTQNRVHRKIVTLFNHILAMDESRLSQVSIGQYLEKTEIYQEVAKSLGEVNPGALYAAINVDMFPRLPAQDRNLIVNKLKQME